MKKSFLKWLLGFCLVAAGSHFLWYYEIFSVMWEKDITKISFGILVVYLYSLLKMGYWLFKDKYEVAEEHTEYYSGLFMKAGLLGTLLSFVFLLSAFLGVDISRPSTVQDLIVRLSTGMSSALFTTVVGLICNILSLGHLRMSK